MFLFKEALSLIIRRLSFNSNRNFLFSFVRTLKFSKDGEWQKSKQKSKVGKSQNKLAKDFRFKDRIPKELTSGAVYKFQCGLCHESYYGECVRHLHVRIGEHIRISPLTRKKVKPKGSAVSDYLLLCYHSPSFENFSVLTNENKKFLLELKESLLTMRDKPSLN